MLVEAKNIKKSFDHRVLLDIEELMIYEGDKIGIVGLNGSGKTTLLNVLYGSEDVDEGSIIRRCEITYHQQFGEREQAKHQYLKEFKVKKLETQEMVSGGEHTKLRFAAALSKPHHVVFMDEPTSNLDTQGIDLVKRKIDEMDTFVLISHDRDLLDETCNKIFELKDGKITEFYGNYSDYKEQSELQFKSDTNEYDKYKNEKKRLEGVYQKKKLKADTVTRRPMGISKHEYRIRNFLTSRPSDGQQKRMNQVAKSVAKRIDQLEVKEKPKEMAQIKMDFELTNPPKNKVVIEGEQLSFGYDELLFDQASFYIENKEHIALVGENGAGKTSLLKLIEQQDKVKVVPKAVLGVLSQSANDLNMERTVLEELMVDSVQSEMFARTILSRMLFARDDLKKKVKVLSGGERIKLQLSKLLVSNANVLLLDEPTNYLDLPSLEQLQLLLQQYEGTVLFVSHDTYFTNQVATHLLVIEDKKLHRFVGNIDDYKNKKEVKKEDVGIKRMVIEMRMSSIVSEMNAGTKNREVLDEEYEKLVKELKDLN